MSTATQTAPWQAQIIQQLEQMTADELDGKTHAVVWNRGDEASAVLHLASSEAEALVQAEDEATKVPGGEVTTAKLTDLQEWIADHEGELLPVEGDESATAADVLEQASNKLTNAVADIIEEAAPGTFGDERLPEGTTAPADADKGRLFDVKVKLDPTKPTVLKLAVSGGVDLDMNKKSDVDFYNTLVAGKTASLEVDVHVAGAKKTHRRDGEGNVDAVVETKSLIVHSIDTE